jgi:uncharacterized protein
MEKKKVTGKQGKRPKHIPQRTCVGCHTVLPKQSLVRIVRRVDQLQIDPTGKLAGRGAYLHKKRACWEKGLKGSLAHALKMTLSPADIVILQEFIQQLPLEDDQETSPMS